MKKFFIISTVISIIIFMIIVFSAAIMNLYQMRSFIIPELKYLWNKPTHQEHRNEMVNPLGKSDRPEPTTPYNNLTLYGDEYIKGAWTKPFDWTSVAVHSVLLPDGKVLTFGSFAGEPVKKTKNIFKNKKIKLTDGFELFRDNGDIQWHHHKVYGGVDFDIWDPEKGVDKNSHTVFKKPIVLDAFCSVIRVFDLDTVFLLGGNKHPVGELDTQNATTFLNLKDNIFIEGNPLNHARWYSSIVRLSDDRFVMIGGVDLKGHGESGLKEVSITPEILEKNNEGTYFWRVLDGASMTNLFNTGVDAVWEDFDGGWSYPKSYLASDGNIFGISYNQLWVMNTEGNGSISKVGEIPLETGGISKVLIDKDLNTQKDKAKLIAGTIGAGVGSTATSVMIDKDKIILIGGDQTGDEYLPSNHVNLIDISDTKNPQVKRLAKMNYPRSNSDAVIFPNGNIFVNGGHSFRDREFSVYNPEVYDVNSNKWKILESATFRRNYHSTSLLLPNGTILVAGGDVWNAEIFYPPYLFEKNWEGKSVFAPRPIIKKISKLITERNNIEIELDDTKDIKKISLISTGSVTHAQASELKYLSLNFKKINNNKISINIPKNKNIVQNGTYLVFAIDSKGVPSIGKIIMLN